MEQIITHVIGIFKDGSAIGAFGMGIIASVIMDIIHPRK